MWVRNVVAVIGGAGGPELDPRRGGGREVEGVYVVAEVRIAQPQPQPHVSGTL